MSRSWWSPARVLGLVVGSLFALSALVAWSAAPAWAHDQLLESTPADGSTVEEAPDEIVLRFSSDLIDLSQDVIVTTPDGERLTGLDVSVDGSRAIAALPEGLGPGAYEVAWRVVSGDGHPIQGQLGFTVSGTAAPAASPPVASPSVAGSPAAGPSAAGPAATPPTQRPSDGSSSSVPLAVWVAGAAIAAAATGAGLLAARRRRG